MIADASDEEGMDSIAQEDSVDTSKEEEQDKEESETIKEQGNTPTGRKQDKKENEKTNGNRKKSASMIEKAMDVVIGKLATLQEASDAQMYALEEKRMKLDERMMELEERHRKEQLDRGQEHRKE